MANPWQFGLRFGDILKIFFQYYIEKRISSRHPGHCKWYPRVPPQPGWKPLAFVLVQPIHSFQVKTPVGLWQSVREQLLDNIFERSFSFYSFLA